MFPFILDLPLLSGVAEDDAFCTRTPDFHFAINGFLLVSSIEIPTVLIDDGPSQFIRTLFESFEMVDDKMVTLGSGAIGALRFLVTTKVRPFPGDSDWPTLPELFSEHQSSERPATSSLSDRRFCWLGGATAVDWTEWSVFWLAFKLWTCALVFCCINSLNTLLVISFSVLSSGDTFARDKMKVDGFMLKLNVLDRDKWSLLDCQFGAFWQPFTMKSQINSESPSVNWH